jgi:hypothetical protein
MVAVRGFELHNAVRQAGREAASKFRSRPLCRLNGQEAASSGGQDRRSKGLLALWGLSGRQWHPRRQTTECRTRPTFGPVALAYLLDGPMSQTALDGHVPISVLGQLSTAGMIRRKMVRHGRHGNRLVVWLTRRRQASRMPQRGLCRGDDPRVFDYLRPCRPRRSAANDAAISPRTRSPGTAGR